MPSEKSLKIARLLMEKYKYEILAGGFDVNSIGKEISEGTTEARITDMARFIDTVEEQGEGA